MKYNPLTLQKIINLLPGHVYWYDKNGIFHGCNDQQARSAGFSKAEDLIGKCIYELQPALIAQALRETNDVVYQTGISQTVEEPGAYSGKNNLIFLSKKAPWRNEEGEIVGIMGISFDVTDEKQRGGELEKAKEDAENTLRNIINLMPGHVYWKDLQFKYLGCNQMQAISLGLKNPAELIGKVDFELPWKNEAQKIRSIDEQVIDTLQMVSTEEPAALSDGRKAIFLSKKVPLKDDKGNVTGILGISFDISDQKDAERLRLENVKAEQNAKVSAMLAAGIAHELRTPLAAIDLLSGQVNEIMERLVEGYTLAVDHGLISEPLSPRNLQIATQAGGRFLQIAHSANLFINMMLMKVNLEKPKGQPLIKLSICSAIEEALQVYPLDESDHALIVWNREVNQPHDFMLMGDPTLFNHVIFNLLKNALHYVKVAQKGQIKIWIERSREQHLLHFKDTGAGIAPTVLPHIFDAFYTQTVHGTGVGLALCKVIMQEFGGDIDCQSLEGAYTHFTLRFPLLR